jgi:hypothetical protein
MEYCQSHIGIMLCVPTKLHVYGSGPSNALEISIFFLFKSNCMFLFVCCNELFDRCITLFRSVRVFCGTDNIQWNIPHVLLWMWWGIVCGMLSIPRSNNVMCSN